jgi:hypothetical protein
MIQNSRDGNGVMRPLITKDQSDRAKEIIENNINAQLGKKTIPDKPVKAPTPPAGDKPTDAQINAQKKGAEIKQIMSGKFSEIPEKLKEASGGQYYFKWENNSWSVYDEDPNNQGAKPKYSGLKNTAESMYKIFSTGAQEQYYKQGTNSKSKTQQKQTFD